MAGRKVCCSYLNVLFLALCCCGLLWQLVMVFELYFRYKVTTFSEVRTPSLIPPMAVSLCSTYTDLLDFERLNRETNRNWVYSEAEADVKRYQDELLISEIFKYTPATDQIIQELRTRDYVSINHKVDNSSTDIQRSASIKKFLYLEFVCYDIQLRHDKTMSLNYYVAAHSYSGMMYHISLNRTLHRSRSFLISLHRRSESHLRSLMYNRHIWREYDYVKDTAAYSAFYSTLTQVDVQLLPSPYESDCFDYSPHFESEVACSQSCIMQTSLQQVGRVPISVVVTNETIDQRFASSLAMSDAHLTKQVNLIESQCSTGACRRSHCSISEGTTTTTAFGDKLFVRVMVPSQAWARIRMRPNLKLVEFLTYAISTISTWTGLSIISLSPRKLSKICRKKITRRNRSICRSEQATTSL